MNVVEHTPAPAKDEAPKLPKYFHYSQNNSGGSFHIDESVAHHVIIEAYTPEEANERAQDIGIYFNGCDDGRDCSCCGDRWYRQRSDDVGTDAPMVYNKSPEEYGDMFTPEGKPVCHVYHLNGSKTTYRKPTNGETK